MDISKHIDCLVKSGMTIADIAAKTGANRATIYRAWSGSGMRLATAQAILKIQPGKQRRGNQENQKCHP